nr:hypothetical protein [Kribbella sp. VKM Ac-2527]
MPDQIAPFVPRTWALLGTDGFGRSDTRAALRRHFGVDAPSIALRVQPQLAGCGELDACVPGEAQRTYDLDAHTNHPGTGPGPAQ